MEHIHFDETGSVKLQELSHVLFDQYKLTSADLLYMAPEVLTCGRVSDKADVWTLGMIVLLCISLEFEIDSFGCK